MKKIISLSILAAFVTASGLGMARADNVIRQIQVLKPDGTPAAGAKAILRLGNNRISSTTPPHQIIEVANDQGLVSINAPRFESGYLMLDTPGCALRFVSWLNQYQDGRLWTEKLSPIYSLNGVTTDEKGAPMGDVDVAVSSEYAIYSSTSYDFNASLKPEGLRTPELATRSNADGSFSLRGFDFSPHIFVNLAAAQINLLASTHRDGVFHAGVSAFKWTLKDSKGPLRIALYPEEPIRGRIFDAISGQPVPGVNVTVRTSLPQKSIDEVRPQPALSSTPWAKTDAQGRFTLTAVRPLSSLGINIKSPEGFWNSAVSLGLDKESILISPDELNVPLYRVASVSGRVTDTSAEMPVVPVSIVGSIEDKLAGGWTNRADLAANYDGGIPVQKDGTFTFKAPAGKVDFTVFSQYAGSDGPIYLAHFEQNVGLENTTDIKFSLSRTPAVLLHWAEFPKEPIPWQSSSVVVQMRSGKGTMTELVHNGPFWRLPVANWGDPLEIRIVSRYIKPEGHIDRELLPWKEFVAKPKGLPYEISLPKDAFALPK